MPLWRHIHGELGVDDEVKDLCIFSVFSALSVFSVNFVSMHVFDFCIPARELEY
jgi:hypothetical protein